MMVSLSLTPERAGGVYVKEDPPTITFGCVSLGEGQNMGQFSLTVCVAIGDFGKPAAVGVATDEREMSDGTALGVMVIGSATGVAVGVVMEVDAGVAATKEESIAVGLL